MIIFTFSINSRLQHSSLNDNLDFKAFGQLVGIIEEDATMLGRELDDLADLIRMAMFIYSYERLRSGEPEIGVFLKAKENNYDPINFRDPFKFYMTFDETNSFPCNNQGTIVYIYEKETDKLIRTFTLE